jgi:hypothetical protein
MRRLLARTAIFVFYSSLTAILLMLGLGLIFPGRSFLPSERIRYRLIMESPRDSVWLFRSVDAVDEFEFTPPSSGVAVYIQASTMGRYGPGGFGAWRSRTWILEGGLTSGGDILAFGASPEPHAQPLSDTFAAAIHRAVERELIPQSPFWQMWPPSASTEFEMWLDRGRTIGWINWSRSSLTASVWACAVLSLGVGGWRAARFRQSRSHRTRSA